MTAGYDTRPEQSEQPQVHEIVVRNWSLASLRSVTRSISATASAIGPYEPMTANRHPPAHNPARRPNPIYDLTVDYI
jgi:hypothetical protein